MDGKALVSLGPVPDEGIMTWDLIGCLEDIWDVGYSSGRLSDLRGLQRIMGKMSRS